MTNTVTLNANELHDLLKPVLPCVGKDDQLPILTHVVIRGVGQHLVAHGTDRYRIAMKRVEIVHKTEEGDLEGPLADGFEAVVSREDLTTILRLFPRTRDWLRNDFIRLTIEAHAGDHGPVLVVETTTHVKFSDLRMTFRVLPIRDYPNVTKIIDAFGGAEPTELLPFALNPEFLADFRVAVSRHEPLQFWLGKSTHSAIFVTAGEDFLAAIMPIRPAEGAGLTRAERAADWRPFFPTSPEDTTKTAAPPEAASDSPVVDVLPSASGESTPGTCRSCGCTDEDCSQCIERTGQPCSWVEPDLCSACASTVSSAAV